MSAVKNLRIPLAARAGETVNRLLRSIEKDRLVERFVAAYVADNNRRGLADDPMRQRELLSTIGREVLLVMVARVNVHLPRYLPRPKPKPAARQRKTGSTRPGSGVEVVPGAEIFLTEFYASLGRALRWTPADADEFLRDLEIYSQLAAPPDKSAGSRRAASKAEGAFVDRCALLLDPSMFENARRAALRFQGEVERATDKILTAILRRR